MKTHLFPDDTELFRRDSMERKTTPMTECAEYSDGLSNQIIPQSFVIREPEGLYRLIYPGTLIPSKPELHYFSAVSEDGIHFRPDTECAGRAGIKDAVAEHQYLPDMNPGSEIFDVFEDPYAEPEARYKMLYTRFVPEDLRVDNRLRISPDGRLWKEVPTVHWHSRGAEPLGSVSPDPFHPGAYLILTRPDWGDRRIAFIRTADWEMFTPPQLAMTADSLDEPMAEHYGIRAFPCGNIMMGFLSVYQPADKSSLHHKFFGGTLRSELVYSRDGACWQRTDRRVFAGNEFKMFGPGTVRREGDNVFLYANTTSAEHGNPVADTICSSVRVYRTKRDRFIALSVKPGAEYGAVALRQCVLRSGELHWNLRAEHATCAIYETHGIQDEKDIKVLRRHEDCIPFSGDSTDWCVRWKSHGNLDDLKGKLVVFELRMKSGEVWSCSGDFTLLGTTEAFRYERFQTLPSRCGF